MEKVLRIFILWFIAFVVAGATMLYVGKSIVTDQNENFQGEITELINETESTPPAK